MDTKVVTKMTADFYEPWDQGKHDTKFAKQLTKQQPYLQTTGNNVSNESRLQFYTEQMIKSKTIDKRDIINWEDRTKARKTKAMKTWSNATKLFSETCGQREEICKRGWRHGQEGEL